MINGEYLNAKDEVFPFTWSGYSYIPSFVAAIIFAVLFAIATIIGLCQIVSSLLQSHATKSKRRQVYSLIPFLIGGILESVGYIGRALNHNDESDVIYLMEFYLLVLAPPLFAISIFLILGIVIKCIQCEKYTPILVKSMNIIFFTGAVISFSIQISGCGVMACPVDGFPQMAERMIVVGIFVLLCFLMLFSIATWKVRYRIIKNPPMIAIFTKQLPSKFRNWHSILISLLICATLSSLRSIMKVIELLLDDTEFINSHECFIYIFDALLMFFTMIVFLYQNVAKFFVDFELISKENLDSDIHAESVVKL